MIFGHIKDWFNKSNKIENELSDLSEIEYLSTQDLYSLLCDMPEEYFNRLTNLIEIAKDTRVQKLEYEMEKKKDAKA